MRHLVILACVTIYAVASPVKNEEVNAKTEAVNEENSPGIVLDISENKEEAEAEGRDIVQVVKTEKDGRKTIHIHSPNPPHINIMPTKYQIAANPQPAFVPYANGPIQANRPTEYGQMPANGPMQYGQEGDKYDYRRRGGHQEPKNQVNIYVYFMNGDNGTMDLDMKKRDKEVNDSKMPSALIKHVTLETPVTKPTLPKETSVQQGTSVPQRTSVPEQKPTLIAVCPKGHVKILGACVEYDQD